MRIRALDLSVLLVIGLCLLLAAAPVTADDNPVLTLEKTSNVSTYDAVDDVITYTYMATNAGNVALDNVTIDDPLPGLSALTCTPLQPATLNLAESMTCMATYTIAQADLDAGSVVNTATADSSQTDPVDDTVTVIVPMFIAIGDQILRAPKSPSTTDPAVETIEIFQEDGVTFNGLVYAGDGLLYACAETNSGPRIFRFDPFYMGQLPVPVETVNTSVASPRCGTVDVDGSLVVASGDGGIWKIDQVAGMRLYDPDPEVTGDEFVDFWYPYGSLSEPLAAKVIPGSNQLGEVADVAYFYNSDFLSVVAASSGGGKGQGQGGGGSKGQLLRSIWPAYQGGFVTEGCPPDSLTKNTKILLDDLGEPTGVALSGGEIYVADGKNLVRVDIPDQTGQYPACVEEPVATVAECTSFGNLKAASLAGDVGGELLVGTGSKNKDAVVYHVDAGCSEDPLLIFPKQDWETTISGLALVPSSLPAEPVILSAAGDTIPLDGSHTYTLAASCVYVPQPSIAAGPATLATVQAHINDIPPGSDQNFEGGDNEIIGSPSAFPGYDGFPWMWRIAACDPDLFDEGDLERHIISSYQRGSNLRIGASDTPCPLPIPGSPPPGPDVCNSEYILLEFNVPFDPDLVPVDPIGGRRRGTKTFLSAAAIADAEPAEFCGYQSPLPSGVNSMEELVLEDLPTTLPVKFKLEALFEEEPEDLICASGQPVDDATVMISVSRIAAESVSDDCPDFEVIFPLEPNGAGVAGPPPLFDDPGQPSGNYHFNLYVSAEGGYCDGDYLITATFLTDNAVEQQTLFSVDAGFNP